MERVTSFCKIGDQAKSIRDEEIKKIAPRVGAASTRPPQGNSRVSLGVVFNEDQQHDQSRADRAHKVDELSYEGVGKR